MNDQNENTTENKFPTEDAKNALKGALKGIPKSFLSKVILFIYFVFIVFTYLGKYILTFRFKLNRQKRLNN